MTRRHSKREESAPEAVLDARRERVSTRLPVRYGVRQPEFEGYAENISDGGMYINTNRVFRNGARLEVEIAFPERKAVLECEVMWAIRVPEHQQSSLVCGMGVRIVRPEGWWSELFRRWRAGLDDERT